jgi:hypothetical protein
VTLGLLLCALANSLCCFVLMGLGLNSDLQACKVGALPLEPHLQSILSGLLEIGA